MDSDEETPCDEEDVSLFLVLLKAEPNTKSDNFLHKLQGYLLLIAF